MRFEAPGDAAAAGRHARAKPLDCADTTAGSDKITIADAAAMANL
jgi:hypothetical protein